MPATENGASEYVDLALGGHLDHGKPLRDVSQRIDLAPSDTEREQVKQHRPPLQLDAIAAPGGTGESAEPIFGRRSWGEVLAMALLPPLATAWVSPDDPLLLGSHFPWLVLVPVLIGVQHGSLAAAVSSALLVGAGVVHQGLGGATPAAALAAFAGGSLATGVIAGHLRDRAQARLARLSVEAKDGAERLSRLARAHAVVKLSHQRLEERLAAHGWSLVSAFEDARRTLAGQSSLASVGDVVLRVLANHGLVQSATLLTLARDGRGRAAFEALARIGNPTSVPPEHALVQRALDTGRLVALDAESADDAGHDVLAVVPLVTASGRMLGLVSIHEMPFMAFQAENLKGLAALAALLADMLEDRFIEAHAEGALLLTPAPEQELHAVAAPSSETRASGGEHGSDERPTEEWLEDELAAGELLAASEPAAETGVSGEFVGNRTGTHRRRSVAQSA